MKIGVSSYSFSQYIHKGKMTQKDAVKKAKELGFEAVEFTDLTPPSGTTREEYAKEIKEEAQKCGIDISAYAVGANLAKRDVKDEIERLKKCVDIAALLGVKLFRHDVMFDYKEYRSFGSALGDIVKSVREITEYAEQLGIKTMTENHGTVCQDSLRVEQLVNAVNHPNFGVLVDMGNFLCADENPAEAVSRIANLAFLVHAKDFVKIDFQNRQKEENGFETRGCNILKGVSVGKGIVPLEQCIAILKRAEYDGYIDVEYEGEEDCIEGLSEGICYLKNIL